MMDQENNNLLKKESEGKGGSVTKKGEDPQLAPGRDLGASVVIAAFSLFVMILALRMPSPGSPFTAPGLLPFFTGLTLLFMAIGLGVRALLAGGMRELARAPSEKIRKTFGDTENLRALLLIGIIILYVIVVQQISFEWRLPTGWFVFQFSGYELFSILTLTVVLRIFWRAALWRCLLVSVCWILALANVFRYVFLILLPGLG